ncbi:MAG TPA: hypothetical protein PLI70_09665 [Gemmatimonadales bacterium]|nr:hypothetical protein [Gemmatimonadales bacterium]HRZ09398.1 hypothetical protein [Gemmatimonadales bacterium]
MHSGNGSQCAGQRARKQAEQEAAVYGAQVQQQDAEFARAMIACLTGKGWTVT